MTNLDSIQFLKYNRIKKLKSMNTNNFRIIFSLVDLNKIHLNGKQKYFQRLVFLLVFLSTIEISSEKIELPQESDSKGKIEENAVKNDGVILQQNQQIRNNPNTTNEKLNLKLMKAINFGFFIDTYYLHNNNSPKSTERKYTTQAVRNGEFNLNLVHLDAKVTEEKYRGRLAIQAGTSVNTNYSNELSNDISSNQASVKNIQEAFVGFKLTSNIWLDCGIFFGNIGRESWISQANWNYTRAFALDYVPYYSSGARLTYEITDKLSIQLQILNGWQVITDNNRDKSFGSQIKYSFSPKLTLTVNQYLGNDAPSNESRQLRLYNNTIFEWDILDFLSFAGQFDIGAQRAKNSLIYELWNKEILANSMIGDYRDAPGNAYRQWYQGTFWIKINLNPDFRLSFRVERMYDPLQVVAITNTKNGFISNAYTATLDILSYDPGLIRLEYVYRRSADSIFDYRNGETSKKEDVFIFAFSLKI